MPFKVMSWLEKLVYEFYNAFMRKVYPLYSIRNILIEVSSFCNLKCPHCYRENFDYESKNKNMSLETFKKIVNEIKPTKWYFLKRYKRTIDLHGIGEPTLNPKINEMVEYASNAGFRILIGTNLNAITLEKYIKMMEKGIDLAIISIDSLRKETMEITRKGTDIKKLIHNLRVLSDRYPDKVFIRTVVSMNNIDELLDIQKLVIDYSIDQNNWVLQPLQIFEDNEFGISEEDIEKVNKILGIDNKLKMRSLPIENVTCRVPRDILTVNVNGDIMPCHQYWDGSIINFGNINQNNLDELYNSKKFNQFKQQLFQGEKIPHECKNCIFR